MDWITIIGQCVMSISKMLILWGRIRLSIIPKNTDIERKSTTNRPFFNLFIVKSRHTWSTYVNYSFKQVQEIEHWTLNIKHEPANKSTSFTIFTLFYCFYLDLMRLRGFSLWIRIHTGYSEAEIFSGSLHLPGVSISCEKMIIWVSKQSISLNFVYICIFMQHFPTFAWKSPRRKFLFRVFFFALGGIFLFTLTFLSSF